MDVERNIQYESKRTGKPRGAGKRALFRIQKVTYDGDKRTQITVKDERIDAANLQFAFGVPTFEQSNILMKEILADLRSKFPKKKTQIHNSENQKLLDTYWELESAY